MKIIAFTGMPFSGKSVAVSIAKEQNIPVIRMGDIVWEEVKKQGLPLNSRTVGKIANDMREQKGGGIWAKKTIEKITLSDINVLVIDGVRNKEEVTLFKKELGDDFQLVAIKTSDKLRYERALQRNRIDDSLNIDEIKERDEREIGWGIKEIIDNADLVIINDNGLEEFQKKIIDIFHSLIKLNTNFKR